MKKTEAIPCMICKKPVRQDRPTFARRQTCARKRVGGKLVKSECEKEKMRRYQAEYRKKKPTQGSPKSVVNRSIALSSVKHLAKFKAKKYDRRCLKCAKKFTGIGAYNRICNHCTIENSRQSYLKGG